jgi:flagellar P-ring protein precursor FlgI
MRVAASILGVLAGAGCALATTVKDITRLEGAGRSTLQGLGLVTGLPGTGDDATDIQTARPLAALLENLGDPIPDLEALASTKSVALVLVKCQVPETGARPNDRFDVTVTSIGSASSLRGGELHLTPLIGPYAGSGVFAIADGRLEMPSDTIDTRGIVYDGAHMIQPISTADVGDVFTLVLDPAIRDWSAASEIAGAINEAIAGRPNAQAPPVARVLDASRIEVTIPSFERAAKAAFLSEVLSTDVNTSLLRLPARVICNPTRGSIVVTGNVTISPVNITHNDLVITTTLPPIEPTPLNPVVERQRWISMQTGARAAESTRLQDLLAAFEQLDIPVREQIGILSDLHASGRLEAKLIISDSADG